MPNSPAPGTPQTAFKAYAATAAGFVVTFVTFWIADTDPFTAKEVAQGLVTAAVSSGLVGTTAFAVKNRAKE